MSELESTTPERICWAQVRALSGAFMDDSMASDPNLNVCPSKCTGSERSAVFIGKPRLPFIKVDICPLDR